MITLTTKGKAVVNKVREKFQALMPTYGLNTFDRVVYEMGTVPAYAIQYALSDWASDDDIDAMVKNGYATKVQ